MNTALVFHVVTQENCLTCWGSQADSWDLDPSSRTLSPVREGRAAVGGGHYMYEPHVSAGGTNGSLYVCRVMHMVQKHTPDFDSLGNIFAK